MNSREWNLVPATLQMKLLLRQITRQWTLPASGLLFMFLIVGLYLGVEAQHNQKLYQAAEQELQPMREMMQQIDSIEAELRTLSTERNRYEQITHGLTPLELLKILTQAIQSCDRAIVLNRFSTQFNEIPATGAVNQNVSQAKLSPLTQTLSVSLSGYSANDATIGQLIDHLKKNGVFAAVELKSSTQSESDKKLAKSFQLQLELISEAKP